MMNTQEFLSIWFVSFSSNYIVADLETFDLIHLF